MFISKILPNSTYQKTNKNNNPNFKAINFAEVEKLTDAVSKQITGKKQIIELYKQFPEAKGITLGPTGLPAAFSGNLPGNSTLPSQGSENPKLSRLSSAAHRQDPGIPWPGLSFSFPFWERVPFLWTYGIFSSFSPGKPAAAENRQ